MKHLVILIAGVLPLAAAIDGTVHVDSGDISGIPTSTPGIYVFRGIPYAAPPVGNLRWRAPRPAAKWAGVRKMDQFQARCVQPLRANPRETQGSEDCLYLNVWTPAKSAADKLPVMVWIHGGGFRDGTGAMLLHDGEELARKAVVLVTINYRLGALGFLAYPELTKESDRHASGNYALMDAIASLQWVQRNIAALGGDPAKLTIFGQSAGSMAVNCLQASPLAKGLFRAVIGESGASFNGMLNNGSLADAEAKGVKFAEALGAKSLAELRAKPAAELITATFTAGPNTDGYVLPEPPLALFQEGKQNRVPALVGSNSDEGSLFARGRMNAQQFVEQAHQRFGDAATEYLKLYPADTDAQAAESRQRSATEENMGLNVRLWAEAQAKAGSKAYVYYFTRMTPGGPPANISADALRLGAPHGEDLAYVFNNIGKTEALRNSDTFRNAQPDAYDLKLAGVVSSYWVNFAKNLDPNGDGLPRWPPFGPTSSDLVMELGDKVGMRPHPDNAGIVFLEKHPFAAAVLPAQTNVVMLWPDGAPGSETWTQKEAEYTVGNSGLKAVRNVVKPSITVYLPPAETATGTSVVVAPGGAFRMLSWDSEGTEVADWLQRHGVAGFVLKYRLTDTGTDEEFAQSQARRAAAGPGGAAGGRGATAGGGAGPQTQIRAMAAADGLRAIEVVRQHAAEWRLDPAKVGIMGFSAGGYVAAQAALDHTAANRPAFVASIYGCCENAAEVKVPDDAPPIFFLHAYNDPVSASSPSLFLAWKAANKPAELHTYAAGGHGFGMPKHDQPTDNWMERFGDWLRYQKLMK